MGLLQFLSFCHKAPSCYHPDFSDTKSTMVDYSNIPRDSRRVPIAAKVQFKFDRFSGFISEYSANISPTGMFIVTDNPEPSGRILDLEFRLGDGFEIIKGQGEVVWVRTEPDGPSRPPGMGIRFMELSPGSQELIYRIVDRYVAQGGTPFDLTGVRPTPVAAAAAPVTPAVPVAPAVPAPPQAPDMALPPLSLEPDPFPDLEPEPGSEASGTVLPWSPSLKETQMRGGDVLPPLEPLDDIFHLEEVPPGTAEPVAAKASPPAQTVLTFPGAQPEPLPAPASALFPPLDPADDLDLTQAGPTVVGFDEPIPDPPSYSAAATAPPSATDLFASYLPQPAAPPEAPNVRPLSTLAGGASVQQPSRRVVPLVLVAVLLAVAAAAFFLRDRIGGWVGLGGGEGEEIVTAEQRPLPRPSGTPPPPPTLQEEMGLTSDTSPDPDPGSAQEPPASAPATPQAESAAAPAPEEPEPQRLPEVVRRKPAPTPVAAPPSGPALTAVDRITFEPAPGRTTVILWGNGAIRPESYNQSNVDSPPRAVIKVFGVRKPFPTALISVRTTEVRQIRIGYHDGNELHIVMDLAGSRVKVARIEPDGQRLRIHLQAQ
jgi:uncharacterized protein (TIGR02266 family)